MTAILSWPQCVKSWDDLLMIQCKITILSYLIIGSGIPSQQVPSHCLIQCWPKELSARFSPFYISVVKLGQRLPQTIHEWVKPIPHNPWVMWYWWNTLSKDVRKDQLGLNRRTWCRVGGLTHYHWTDRSSKVDQKSLTLWLVSIMLLCHNDETALFRHDEDFIVVTWSRVMISYDLGLWKHNVSPPSEASGQGPVLQTVYELLIQILKKCDAFIWKISIMIWFWWVQNFAHVMTAELLKCAKLWLDWVIRIKFRAWINFHNIFIMRS